MGILFLKTTLIGLSIAAPVGPIGLLCIERTLRSGRALGIATGFGAAMADAVYGAIGVLGMSAVTGLLLQAQGVLQTVGAAFLIFLAYRTWIASSPSKAQAAPPAASPWVAFFGTFMLTLSSPMTILSFMAIFAALAPPGDATHVDTVLMIAGVLFGSALWWIFLVAVVSRAAGAVSSKVQAGIRRGSALLLFGFGAWQLAQVT